MVARGGVEPPTFRFSAEDSGKSRAGNCLSCRGLAICPTNHEQIRTGSAQLEGKVFSIRQCNRRAQKHIPEYEHNNNAVRQPPRTG
jgi:hypothetical protein